MSLSTIILAAGKSTRMLSLKSKLLFKISSDPIIEHVYRTAKSVSSNEIICVLGDAPKELLDFVKKNKLKTVLQKKPHGTADAVKIAIKFKTIKNNNKILILCGDVPFISSKSLKAIIKKTNDNDLCLGTAILENPSGYGRIVRHNNNIIKIVEEKDANNKIKKINEVNTGILCIKEGVLRKYIQKM